MDPVWWGAIQNHGSDAWHNMVETNQSVRMVRSSNLHLSSILFGDTMVPNIQQDYILLLGYSFLYKEYNLTRFNHQKNATHLKS